jgi:hypothetical protein
VHVLHHSGWNLGKEGAEGIVTKKYVSPLTPAQLAEVTIGICAALTDTVSKLFAPEQRESRAFRQMTDLNQRLVGMMVHLENTSRVDALEVAGRIVDAFNAALIKEGLVVEETTDGQEEAANETAEGEETDPKPAA